MMTEITRKLEQIEKGEKGKGILLEAGKNPRSLSEYSGGQLQGILERRFCQSEKVFLCDTAYIGLQMERLTTQEQQN